MLHPKLSIVMSVYNAEVYLRKAIDSVLNQTFKEFEFIIVDDCSIDSSKEIIKSYNDERIILIENQQNLGLSKSCNFAISKAKSEIIVRMDSDDICYPNRLEVQYQYLQDHPDVVLIGSNADIIDMEDKFIHKTNLPLTDDALKTSVKHKATFIHPSVAYRKACFEKVGGYYEPIKHYFEDFILWNQLASLGKFHVIEESLIQYRVVMNSISTTIASPKYLEIEKKVAQNGFATQEQLNFIFEEKKKVGSIKNKQIGYYQVLAQRIIFHGSDTQFARLSLLKSFKANPCSIKTYILLVLSFMPKAVLNLIYKLGSK
jgi:glycosyltransferase involved in cell wall biosynthesis